MKRIKRIGVIVHIPVADTANATANAAYYKKLCENILNENRKLRSENEALKMQLASKDHYANKADEILHKLAAELKENGFC